MADSPAQLQEFQKRILAAHENRDFVFLEKLNKAIRLTNRPAPAMNAYRGAIEAFAQLFLDNESTTRDEWPTKQMVRERAKKILSEAGHAPISDRHWPRVFRQAGLAELPQGGYNRP